MPSNRTDRKFMEQAVAEMRKSRSEHPDERDPLVGAVLVMKNGTVGAESFRGDLRVGNHAEYILIERRLRDKDLEGATLYVTLEPCSKRNPPKKPCAEWVAGARIGRVVVGMTDPNPDISGRGIQYLLDKEIPVDFFDVDLVKQIREANRKFIEYCEGQDGRKPGGTEMFEGPSREELQIVERASLDDLSRDVIAQHLARRGTDDDLPISKVWGLLEKGGYLGRNVRGKRVPTVAGIILFGKDPANILPQCRVSIEAKTAGRTISGDFEGPLMAFRDHLDAFLKDHMRHFTEIRGLDRVKVGEYPMEAVREAAFNAVVHRDYQGGTRIHITLKEGLLEVRSPGGLLKPLSLSRVRAFNAPPYSRNPHIALAVQRMGWIDEKGSGLGRMRDTMVAHGLPPPLFDLKDGYFVVSLPGGGAAWTNVRVAPKLVASLEEQQRRILDLVIARGKLASGECAKALDVDVATARRHLRGLVDRGILGPRGSGPRVTYQLAGTE